MELIYATKDIHALYLHLALQQLHCLSHLRHLLPPSHLALAHRLSQRLRKDCLEWDRPQQTKTKLIQTPMYK